MSDFAGLAAAAASLKRYLDLSFAAEQPLAGDPTTVAIVRSDDLEPATFSSLVERPALTLHVYRVDFDPVTRSAAAGAGASGRRKSAMALQMHILITPWASNADEEMRILGRTMQALEQTPILSGPLLAGEGWGPDESLQVLLESMDTSSLLRIFDSLPVDYRLSVPYVAKVLRLAGQKAEGPAVVTSIIAARPSLDGAA